ncbi:MlaE family lipid ABC transporter permease subunit [candidate division KSB1 bacterium]|nr:MlaE family lipid ABC transporter permease subunit [candidate division KSB1 bacterium]
MHTLRIKDNIIKIQGNVKIPDISDLDTQIRKAMTASPESEYYLDLSEVTEIDSAGVAFLDELIEKPPRSDIKIATIHTPSNIRTTIENFTTSNLTFLSKSFKINVFEKLGDMVYGGRENIRNLIYLISDIFYWSVYGIFNHKGQRAGSFTQQSILIGADAVKIVATLSLLIGFILALQSAAQLRQFGANIYIADLIGISITAEMGPIMTAIILAGRSGSAIAAEIATMVVTEEVDALKSMGLNPIRYIIVPKFHAISVCMPLLTIIADFVGIFGGFIIGVTYLELSPTAFINELLTVIFPIDIISGLVKSFVFAWIIAIVGSYFGLNVKGGAEGVGKATTASVVASIFVIIIADSILGLIFYFGKPAY